MHQLPLFSLGAETVLQCPGCRSQYLHHYRVDVFDRPREDAVSGLHVTVNAGTLAVTTDLADCPSARRDGVRIFFYCENCCAVPALSLAQHKGQSFLWWEDRHGGAACGPDCDRAPQAVSASYANGAGV
jgi:hypothetical protein